MHLSAGVAMKSRTKACPECHNWTGHRVGCGIPRIDPETAQLTIDALTKMRAKAKPKHRPSFTREIKIQRKRLWWRLGCSEDV